MINVTVDVTGMYFSFAVKVEPKLSVQKILEEVQTATVGTNQEFKFVPKANPLGHIFVEEISVHHKTPPTSRQKPFGGGAPNTYRAGLYLWNDRVNPSLPESIPQIIWQYYVTDKDGKSKSGKFGGSRIVVPFSKSDIGSHPEGPIEFEDGDVITWRMVGIFVRKDTNSDPGETVKFAIG